MKDSLLSGERAHAESGSQIEQSGQLERTYLVEKELA
jgi:hypothetical protein